MEHPEAHRMLNDIRSGRIQGVIFSKMARLARNTRELLEFSEIFNNHGADLISIQEQIDTSSAGGRLFFTLLAAITQWEREEIVERIKASIPIRAKLGKPLSGNATLGYHWVDKRLVPDLQKAPVRRLLFVLLARHRRIRTVVTILNSAGYRTARGALFDFRTVRRLIRDPTPVGLHRSNYTTLTEGGLVRFKPESDWVINQVEPIVSKELWEYCNRLLDQRENGDRPGRRPKYVFGGVLWCNCGHKMYVPSNTPRYVCRVCRNKVSLAAMEALFLRYVAPTITTSMPPAVQDATANTLSFSENLREVVEANGLRATNELIRLEALHTAGHISVAGYQSRRVIVDQRIDGLNRERTRLKSLIDRLRSRAAENGGTPVVACNTMAWSEMNAEEKSRLIQDWVRRVEIGAGIVVFWVRSDKGEGVIRGTIGNSNLDPVDPLRA
jgi:site-specific DNA recombinase